MKAVSTYKKQTHTTASKEHIMVLLFQKALSCINETIVHFEKGASDEGQEPGQKAIDIIIELRRSLNTDVAPELCNQLHDLYGFTIARLTMGLMDDDISAVKEAQVAFAPIADAFSSAVKKVKTSNS